MSNMPRSRLKNSFPWEEELQCKLLACIGNNNTHPIKEALQFLLREMKDYVNSCISERKCKRATHLCLILRNYLTHLDVRQKDFHSDVSVKSLRMSVLSVLIDVQLFRALLYKKPLCVEDIISQIVKDALLFTGFDLRLLWDVLLQSTAIKEKMDKQVNYAVLERLVSETNFQSHLPNAEDYLKGLLCFRLWYKNSSKTQKRSILSKALKLHAPKHLGRWIVSHDINSLPLFQKKAELKTFVKPFLKTVEQDVADDLFKVLSCDTMQEASEMNALQSASTAHFNFKDDEEYFSLLTDDQCDKTADELLILINESIADLAKSSDSSHANATEFSQQQKKLKSFSTLMDFTSSDESSSDNTKCFNKQTTGLSSFRSVNTDSPICLIDSDSETNPEPSNTVQVPSEKSAKHSNSFKRSDVMHLFVTDDGSSSTVENLCLNQGTQRSVSAFSNNLEKTPCSFQAKTDFSQSPFRESSIQSVSSSRGNVEKNVSSLLTKNAEKVVGGFSLCTTGSENLLVTSEKTATSESSNSIIVVLNDVEIQDKPPVLEQERTVSYRTRRNRRSLSHEAVDFSDKGLLFVANMSTQTEFSVSSSTSNDSNVPKLGAERQTLPDTTVASIIGSCENTVSNDCLSSQAVINKSNGPTSVSNTNEYQHPFLKVIPQLNRNIDSSTVQIAKPNKMQDSNSEHETSEFSIFKVMSSEKMFAFDDTLDSNMPVLVNVNEVASSETVFSPIKHSQLDGYGSSESNHLILESDSDFESQSVFPSPKRDQIVGRRSIHSPKELNYSEIDFVSPKTSFCKNNLVITSMFREEIATKNGGSVETFDRGLCDNEVSTLFEKSEIKLNKNQQCLSDTETLPNESPKCFLSKADEEGESVDDKTSHMGNPPNKVENVCPRSKRLRKFVIQISDDSHSSDSDVSPIESKTGDISEDDSESVVSNSQSSEDDLPLLNISKFLKSTEPGPSLVKTNYTSLKRSEDCHMKKTDSKRTPLKVLRQSHSRQGELNMNLEIILNEIGDDDKEEGISDCFSISNRKWHSSASNESSADKNASSQVSVQSVRQIELAGISNQVLIPKNSDNTVITRSASRKTSLRRLCDTSDSSKVIDEKKIRPNTGYSFRPRRQ